MSTQAGFAELNPFTIAWAVATSAANRLVFGGSSEVVVCSVDASSGSFTLCVPPSTDSELLEPKHAPMVIRLPFPPTATKGDRRQVTLWRSHCQMSDGFGSGAETTGPHKLAYHKK